MFYALNKLHLSAYKGTPSGKGSVAESNRPFSLSKLRSFPSPVKAGARKKTVCLTTDRLLRYCKLSFAAIFFAKAI